MLISNRALRTGIKPTPHQKSYEKNTGFQSFVVHCRGANKQIFLLSISLVYYKSDQHNTIFDSYNIEVATNKIRSITLENAANTYSAFNGIKLDLEDDRHKFLLHRQFVSWVCVGCSIASFTDYSNNEVAIELPNVKKYFPESDEKLYIELRRSKGYTSELEMLSRDDSDLTPAITLKNAATK